jgi:hypothetical protein
MVACGRSSGRWRWRGGRGGRRFRFRLKGLGELYCHGGEYMKNLGILGIVVATTVTAVFPLGNRLSAKPNAAVEAATNQEVAKSTVPSKERAESSEQDLSALLEEKAELHPEPLEHMLVAAPVGVGWDGQGRLAGGALARRQHSSNSNTAERVLVPGERPGLI